MSEETNIPFWKLTREQRWKIMEENPPTVSTAYDAAGYFDWSWKGCGFGQLSFAYDRETDSWDCETETMGPKSTRMLLHAFADFVADQIEPVLLRDAALDEVRMTGRQVVYLREKLAETQDSAIEKQIKDCEDEITKQQAIADEFQEKIDAAHRARAEERAAFRRTFKRGIEEAGEDGL